MYEYVTRKNIVHFETLLRQSLDTDQRRSIERLLASERAKLAALVAEHGLGSAPHAPLSPSQPDGQTAAPEPGAPDR